MRPKQRVLGMLLDLLGAYVSPEDAVLATLGGEGLEAAVWEQAGVCAENGWLVERSRRRMRGLLRGHRAYHHFQGNLTGFPKAFRGYHGRHAALDLFHWDLCGTVEPAIEEVCGILPSLMYGRGHCLAVTTADMRRNRTLQDHERMLHVCAQAFGPAWPDLWQDLLGLHRAEANHRLCVDPEKAALREAGTLLYLAFALATVELGDDGFAMHREQYPLKRFVELCRGSESPEDLKRLFADCRWAMSLGRLERFTYASGATGFRMRTYFFRLEQAGRHLRIGSWMRRLAALLKTSSCHVVDADSSCQIWPLAEERKAPVEEASPKENSLMERVQAIKTVFASHLTFAPSELKQSFEELCDLAEKGEQAVDQLEAIRKMLNGGNGHAPSVAVNPSSTVPVNPQLTPSDIARLQEVERLDDAREEMLVSRLLGEQAFAAKQKEIVKRFSLGRAPGHKLGAIFANCQGGLRGKFIKRRLEKAQREGVAEEVALEALSAKYPERPTHDVLRAEAQAFGYTG